MFTRDLLVNTRVPTLPAPNTAQGDARRLAFAEIIADIVASPVRIWLPKHGETTESTTVDSNKATVTYSADLSTWATTPSHLGSGMVLTFDGAGNYAEMPDAADLSFGNGTLDAPFSLFAFIKVGATAGYQDIITKWDLATAAEKREFTLFLDPGEKLVVTCYDESADAWIERSYSVALTAGSRYLVGLTYDGRGAVGGLGIWANAAKVDDTDSSTGSYTAMENLAGTVRIGAHKAAAGGVGSPFASDIYFGGICAGELHLDQWRRLLLATDDFYGTALSA